MARRDRTQTALAVARRRRRVIPHPRLTQAA
jgi:hypothetical protein